MFIILNPQNISKNLLHICLTVLTHELLLSVNTLLLTNEE